MPQCQNKRKLTTSERYTTPHQLLCLSKASLYSLLLGMMRRPRGYYGGWRASGRTQPHTYRAWTTGIGGLTVGRDRSQDLDSTRRHEAAVPRGGTVLLRKRMQTERGGTKQQSRVGGSSSGSECRQHAAVRNSGPAWMVPHLRSRLVCAEFLVRAVSSPSVRAVSSPSSGAKM